MPEGLRRRGALARDDDPPADDDFLFHLSRGSELLVQNRVVEAKEELERALSVRPRDAQGTDLLAGVYFRLGVYPTAIGLWRGLVREFPDDAILRVNLGLALFKTGQPEDARQHLEHALSLEPKHERAWGYLGLTLWRLGKLEEAREAFLRGGQVSMAARMGEALSESERPSPPPAVDDAQLSAVRSAAGEAAERLGASGVSLSVEAERPRGPSGEWSVVETGADPVPRALASRPIAALVPPTLAALSASWALELPEDTPLAVGVEGELLVCSGAAVHSRLSGLRAVRGPLRTEPVERRSRGRGRGSDEPLGGAGDPIVRWQGPVAAVLAPPDGLRYHALRIGGSLLYVREELVHAFDDRVGYESGKLPLAGEPVILLSFHGEGTVVLRLPRRPSGLEVRPEDEVHVDPHALVGWTGRLFPSAVPEPAPASAPLAFRGQGIVLVT